MCTSDLHNAHPSHESLPTYSNFHLKITLENVLKISTENLTNISCHPDQFWKPFGLPKIVPKSCQNHKKSSARPKKDALALPKLPRRLQIPPQASKKAPEASADASKSFKNGSKKPQDGKSHTPIHNSLQFAVNSNIPSPKTPDLLEQEKTHSKRNSKPRLRCWCSLRRLNNAS